MAYYHMITACFIALVASTLVGASETEMDALCNLYHRGMNLTWDSCCGTNTTFNPCTWPKTIPVCSFYLQGVICSPVDGSITKLDFGGAGLEGTIPEVIFNLTNLTSIILFNNNLTGTISPRFAELTKLKSISLYWNNLTGTIPPEIGTKLDLTSFSVSHNLLSGFIPPFPGTGLVSFSAGQNFFTGAMPLNSFPAVRVLDVSANKLSGNLSFMSSMNLIHTLMIGDNQFGGSLPKKYPGTLSYFNASFNLLEGEVSFPPSIYSLDLSHNLLSGNLPSSLKNLTGLSRLHLQNNMLTGALPVTFPKYLSRLNVANNLLSGALEGLTTADNLRFLNLENNKLSGELLSLPNQWVNTCNLNNNCLDCSLVDPKCACQSTKAFEACPDNLVLSVKYCDRRTLSAASFRQLDYSD